MGKLVDIAGLKFGKLTVLSYAGVNGSKRPKPQWLCSCECGQNAICTGENLKSGKTKSCGCTSGNFKHGHCVGRYNGGRDSPTRQTWSAMIARCTNPKHSAYPRYGALGINVCERWKKFENFLHDMGDRPRGCTLDRIDGSKGYSPDNCRWATTRQQFENKRVVRDASGKFTRSD